MEEGEGKNNEIGKLKEGSRSQKKVWTPRGRRGLGEEKRRSRRVRGKDEQREKRRIEKNKIQITHKVIWALFRALFCPPNGQKHPHFPTPKK